MEADVTYEIKEHVQSTPIYTLQYSEYIYTTQTRYSEKGATIE